MKIALSTASTFPDSTASAFELAARLGYDGVELMPLADPASQDLDAVRRLSDDHGVPVLSVHTPCLLATQRVWSTNPWRKLVTARKVAEALGASTVVVHPPFRWQREYPRSSSPTSTGWPSTPTSSSRSRTCSRGARVRRRSPRTCPGG